MESFCNLAVVIAVTLVFVQSLILHRAMRRIVTLGLALKEILIDATTKLPGGALQKSVVDDVRSSSKEIVRDHPPGTGRLSAEETL